MAGRHGNKKKKYKKLEKEQIQLQEGPAPPEETKKKKRRRSSKKVHLSPLPDRYDPLEEGDNREEEEGDSKEDKRYKRKQKVKKYAKNVGKAVRTCGRYLLIGLQGLASAYASPFGVVLSTASH